MSDRPTPDQIAYGGADEMITFRARASLLEELASHGYVIVNPDDHERAEHDYTQGRFQRAWNDGYNQCHDDIFGTVTP